MDKSLIAALLLLPLTALGQTHTFPGNNVFPSTSTVDFASGSTVDFTGATVTGLSVSGALQWDGGATNLVSATGRTSLGGTTVGQSFFTLANPGAVSFPEISAGNAVSAVSAATMRTDLGVQAADADLTTWAGITPVAAVGTWIATPSSANLRSAVTDENGTGALLFSGATTPDFTTGFTVGGAAAAGKILIGNGTNYVVSTPTYPTAAGAVGYTIRSDATNFAAYPQDIINSSVTNQTPSTSEVYVAGSNVVVTAGDFKAKGQYHCVFDIVKSAGTGIPVVAVKIGTLGTTSDTTQLTFTFPGAGTSVADTGTIEVIANWRTVGSGSSAVVSGVCRAQKNTITAAGLWGTTTAALTIVSTVSGGFNSSAATTMGVTFNGGTAFAGTITTVQATLMQ